MHEEENDQSRCLKRCPPSRSVQYVALARLGIACQRTGVKVQRPRVSGETDDRIASEEYKANAVEATP